MKDKKKFLKARKVIINTFIYGGVFLILSAFFQSWIEWYYFVFSGLLSFNYGGYWAGKVYYEVERKGQTVYIGYDLRTAGDLALRLEHEKERYLFKLSNEKNTVFVKAQKLIT